MEISTRSVLPWWQDGVQIRLVSLLLVFLCLLLSIQGALLLSLLAFLGDGSGDDFRLTILDKRLNLVGHHSSSSLP